MKTPPIKMVYPYATAAGEREIRLRNKEWLLLDYLLHHRGELVTQYEILRDVWRYPDSAIRAIITTHPVSTTLSRLQSAMPELIIARAYKLGWVLV